MQIRGGRGGNAFEEEISPALGLEISPEILHRGGDTGRCETGERFLIPAAKSGIVSMLSENPAILMGFEAVGDAVFRGGDNRSPAG